MSEAANTQVVKDAYAAFQRGDIDGVLGLVGDDVEWEAVKGTEGVVPTAGVRRGRRGVAEFFSQLAQWADFQQFEPREFIAQGDQVVAIGAYTLTVKPTSRRVAAEWVMVFTIRDGRIARFREWTDSAQLVQAFAPVTVGGGARSS
jgi:ketosteroid isomerase-like protein